MAIFRDKAKAGNRATAAALVIAAGLLVWQLVAEAGPLGPFINGNIVLFGPLLLVWLACVIAAIRWRRRWWLLVTAPVVLFPVAVVIAIIRACLDGRCL
ncbi:hypothetical protein ACLBXM_07550 [Xanthobacteraceae bacterium A53D]